MCSKGTVPSKDNLFVNVLLLDLSESQDESKSSFLHSASPEKSSGTVQNQTCEKKLP